MQMCIADNAEYGRPRDTLQKGDTAGGRLANIFTHRSEKQYTAVRGVFQL